MIEYLYRSTIVEPSYEWMSVEWQFNTYKHPEVTRTTMLEF